MSKGCLPNTIMSVKLVDFPRFVSNCRHLSDGVSNKVPSIVRPEILAKMGD